MKNLKTVFSIFALIAFSGVIAQTTNKQVTSEVLQKKYTISNGNETINYSIKINSQEKSSVKMEATDRNKKEQNRVKDKYLITKLIRIDSDSDSRYDNVLQLSYESQKDDNFNVYETAQGFVIEVTGKKLDYNFLKKVYALTNKSKDTFEVVVLKSYK